MKNSTSEVIQHQKFPTCTLQKYIYNMHFCSMVVKITCGSNLPGDKTLNGVGEHDDYGVGIARCIGHPVRQTVIVEKIACNGEKWMSADNCITSTNTLIIHIQNYKDARVMFHGRTLQTQKPFFS